MEITIEKSRNQEENVYANRSQQKDVKSSNSFQRSEEMNRRRSKSFYLKFRS